MRSSKLGPQFDLAVLEKKAFILAVCGSKKRTGYKVGYIFLSNAKNPLF